jgi:hypothetical protein
MRHLPTRLAAFTAVSLASLMALSGCGGGGDGASTTSESPTGLSGTVAVGAPITNGKLRVMDATGAVVASDVTIDADGRYEDVALTGPAPYRIEACGYAGPNYTCVYSVASGVGTANVTPLTTATVLLATGQAPDALMTGTAPALTTASVETAQTQLRTSLSSMLASAGVPNSFDFVSGSLTAGSRSGYDGVLDAVGVTVGQDANPFVQISPRIGSGNLYLEQGTSVGTMTANGSAASLQLSGLEQLFRNMTQSLASSSACASTTTGIARSLAANAQMSLGDGGPATGVAQVAQGLCEFFASGEDGVTPMWGSRMLSPTLGRCDQSGASPVCGVSFVLSNPEGDVVPVGGGMGVTQENGVWKFMGDLMPIQIQASAKAQRTKRIDTTTPVYEYNRALAFEVAALPGLACAKVAQLDTNGTPVTMGFYKTHPGAVNQRRLALWTTDGFGNGASTNALVGATRSADDSWIGLPDGTAGDAVIRNFYRGGRSVTVSLYSDANCSAPFALNGQSVFEVEVEGVPPVSSALATMPWPEIDADTQAALRNLTLAGGATGTLPTAWSFTRGPLGLNGATVCSSRATCGQGGTGRIGERSLRPSSRDANVPLTNTGPAVAADDEKTLALYGRNGEGVDLQSNYSSCPASNPTDGCH